MFSTTIKKDCFLKKIQWAKDNLKSMNHAFFIEFKETSKFWNTRLNNISIPCDGVLLVGNKPFKIEVWAIKKLPINKCKIPGYVLEVVKGPIIWAVVCRFQGNEIPGYTFGGS